MKSHDLSGKGEANAGSVLFGSVERHKDFLTALLADWGSVVAHFNYHIFQGIKGYGDFKAAVAEAVAEEIRPLREEYERILADKAYIEACAKAGAEKAQRLADRTMNKVMKKVGFYRF